MMKLFGLGSEPAKPAPQTQRPPGPASSSGKPPPASQAQHNPAPATQPQPKREEPRAGGGFFNLPVAGAAAAAPSVPVSAPSNDLFGALSTHTASTSSPAAAPAPFSLMDAGGGGTTGFNFLQPASGAAAPTSFSFLTAPADAPPVSLDGGAAPGSGFSFLAAPAPVESGGRRPSASLPAATVSSTPPSAVAPPAVVVVQPAVVKKRKTGFRVGVASAPGGSVLAGLQVHGNPDDAGADGQEDDVAPVSALPPAQPASSGGMLAGLQIHHGATLTEPSTSGATAGRTDVLSGGGGVLSGLQVHDPPESPPAPSSFSIAGAAASAGATSSAAAVFPLRPEADSDGGVFAGLMTKAAPVTADKSATGGATQASSARSPAPSSTQARAMSPTARKRAVIAELDGAARKLRMRLAEIKQKLRASVDSDKRAAAELSATRDRLAQKEAEQDDAIRHERFEAAEALNAAIEETRAKVARCEQVRRQIASERASLEAEQEAAFAESLAASSDAVLGLKRYSDDREDVLHVFCREALTRLTSASDRIANDEEQLRLKEDHVRLETKLVDEETQQVHRAITDQTDELNAQVTEMRARHTQLVQDVADLERQLEAKRKEERMASSQLADSEARIKSIHAKFDKQTKRLQAKRAAVDTEQAECSAEAEAISHATFERDKTRAADAIAEQAYRRQIAHTRVELSLAEALRGALLEQADRRRKWTLTAASVAKKTSQLGEGLESGVKALRMVQSKRAGLEAQSRGVRDRIAAIDGKAPQLTEEKRLAVNERKFKEAGRLTSELKRLADDRDVADKELSVVLSAIDECDAEVASREAELAAARESMAAFERTADLARIEALRAAIRAIRRQIRTLGRATPANRATAAHPNTDPLTGSATPAEAASFELHVPGNSELGIDVESDGRTSGQAAALDLLACERDLLTDELSQVCSRWGHELDVGDETPDEDAKEVTVAVPTPPSLAAPVAVFSSPTSDTASASHEASEDQATQPSFVSAAAAAVASSTETPAPWSLPSALLPDSGAAVAEVAVDGALPSSFGFLMSSPAAASGPLLEGGIGLVIGGSEGGGLDLLAGLTVAPAAASEPDGQDAPGEVSLPTPDAAAVAAPSAEELEAERARRLAELASALRAADAAISEKQAIIDASVVQEDYDTADAAQVDIDSLLEHRAGVLRSAADLGVADEAELLSSPALG